MNNLRSKTDNIKNGSKEYLKRLVNLNIYSYTKPNDKKLLIGCRPTDLYTLFNGNTSAIKKEIGETLPNVIYPDDVSIDQSVVQYYIILAIQDLYFNHLSKLEEKVEEINERLTMLQTLVLSLKKKNDERFEVLSKNIHNIGTALNDNRNVN